jgi:hypothetical protein
MDPLTFADWPPAGWPGRELSPKGRSQMDKLLVLGLCDHGDAAHCPNLRTDVLKVPHHGSAKFDREFLSAVHPE